jgi:hypothetical protein
MNYASCSSVQVFHRARSRGSYSLYHWKAELRSGIGCLKMVHLLLGRKLCLSFIPSFILQVKFIKTAIEYITFGLMMKRVLPKRGGDWSY